MKSAIRWGGSLILLVFLAVRLDWSQVAGCFARLNLGLWVLSIALYTVCQLLSVVRWQMLSRVLGFHGTYPHYVGIYHIGMFFNLLLPTSVGGDVVRAWYLAGMQNTLSPARRTLAALSVLADRVSGVALLIVLACLALPLSPVPLPSWIQIAVVAIGVGMILGGVLVLLAARVAPRLVTRLSRRVQALALRLLSTVPLFLRHPRLLLVTSLLSFAVQVVGVAMVWCVSLGLGLEVPLVCYGVVVPLTALLTLLPVSINGMGLREAAMVLMLAPLGVATAAAVSLSFLVFLATMVCSLAGLGFYLFGNYPRYRPQKLEETGNDRAVGSDSDQGREGQSRAAA